MGAIFRDGFYRNIFVVVVVGVLIGALITIALAGVVDKYLGSFVGGLLGNAGEYDVIVHIRAEMADATEKELRKLMSDRFPGVKVEESVTVAGNTNYLIALPEKHRNREAFESFSHLLRDLPGGNGYTLITEPRITVRVAAPQIRDYVLDRVSSAVWKA